MPDSLFEPGALALMRDAKAAGHRVGVLSNDAYSINDPAFFEGRPEFAGLDAFVDASDLGVRKPHPDTYLAAARALGVPPEAVVFLDDTPECVEGARAVGMFGIHVDPQANDAAFDRARELLGLARSRFCTLVGCRLPIQQAVMTHAGTAALAVSVSEAGGLGMLAIGRQSRP